MSCRERSSTIDVRLDDGLPCSRCVKGVGIGACVKRFRDKVCICSRFSDASVSLFEDSILLKIRGEIEF